LHWVSFMTCIMMSQGRHRKYNHGIYFKHRENV